MHRRVRYWIVQFMMLVALAGFSIAGYGQAPADADGNPPSAASQEPQPATPPDQAQSKDDQAAPSNPATDKPATDKPATDKPDEPKKDASKQGDDNKDQAKKDQAKKDASKADDKDAPEKDQAGADKDKGEIKKDAQPKPLPTYGYSDTPMIPGQPWRVHDVLRPRPRTITPGQLSTYEQPGTAPSDAVVLFDGTNLDNWAHQGPEGPADLRVPQWKVQDGYMEIVPRSGSLRSIDSFGSCQLHIEWAAPEKVVGDSQGRGNSGVLLMGEYEVQVLDSYNNRTYADGQAGALYGQYPPMVNAARPPGEWQVYDIVFEAPRFDLEGNLLSPAYVSVMHNGVILHHRREMLGPSRHKIVPQYDPQQPAAPLQLQDHGNPVRYRNIWIRPLDFD